MSVSPPAQGRAAAGQACQVGLALLLGTAPLIFARTAGEFDDHPKAVFLQVGILLLALYWLLAPGRRVDLRPARSPLDSPVAWFALACLLSLVAAVNVFESVPLLLHRASCVVLFFLVARALSGPQAVPRFFLAATLSALLVGLVGLAQAYLGLEWIPQAMPPGGTFSNRNMASHHVAICFPLGLGLIAVTRRVPTLILAGVGLAVSTAYLLTTRAHAAWLAALLVTLVSAAGSRGHLSREGPVSPRGRLAVAAAAILVGGLLVAGLARGGLDGATRDAPRGLASLAGLDTGTTGLRLIYWKNGLAMARDHPLVGVGLGNFKLLYPLYHRAVEVDWTFDEEHQLQRVHNDHLQILIELGIVGLAAWIWIFVAALRLARNCMSRPEPWRASQAFFVSQGLLAFWVVACFSFPMQRAMPPAWTFALLGMLAFLAGPANRETAAPPRATASARLVAATLLTLLLVASVVVSRQTLLADRLFTEASGQAAMRQHGRAVEVLQRARSIAPRRPDLLLELARNQAATGRWEAALETLDSVLRLQPYQVNAISNAGLCSQRLQRYEQAGHYFERAAKLLPDSPQAFTHLGTAYRGLGRNEQAIAAYRRAIELARTEHHLPSAREVGRELQPRLLLAALYVELGRPFEAIEQYEAVLGEHPAREDIRGLLDELRRSGGPVPAS